MYWHSWGALKRYEVSAVEPLINWISNLGPRKLAISVGFIAFLVVLLYTVG